MKKTLFASAIALLVAQATVAQTVAPAARTQAGERARIRQGVATGELNRREAARLHAQQADIRQDKQAARADGVVTPAERQGIRQETRQASRSIYRQKHDAQVRR